MILRAVEKEDVRDGIRRRMGERGFRIRAHGDGVFGHGHLRVGEVEREPKETEGVTSEDDVITTRMGNEAER